MQDHEAPGASCEAWSELDMRMASGGIPTTVYTDALTTHDMLALDGQAGKHFALPLFSKIFELSEYPTNWRELIQPHSFDKDDVSLDYLSLQGETKSFFGDLNSIFGCAKGDAVLGHEGRSTQSLDVVTGSGSGTGQALAPSMARGLLRVQGWGVFLWKRERRGEIEKGGKDQRGLYHPPWF
ncbi:hypothetical protein AMTR_s00043p00200800 [Amborella trichopoda]|uniref:Uncharacterized protein n=1 Tax=Amborella trichopoda TaxID=13333 RepID=W1PXZ5_AMBTC|nr:hypothetical protein AMTR_s00043p00200800 [Amborella trichopoda]